MSDTAPGYVCAELPSCNADLHTDRCPKQPSFDPGGDVPDPRDYGTSDHPLTEAEWRAQPSGGSEQKVGAADPPPMTPQETEALAARTLTAIGSVMHGTADAATRAADRERVASDLDGCRRHFLSGSECGWCEIAPYPCPDFLTFTAGLRRTAALYGVNSS